MVNKTSHNAYQTTCFDAPRFSQLHLSRREISIAIASQQPCTIEDLAKGFGTNTVTARKFVDRYVREGTLVKYVKMGTLALYKTPDCPIELEDIPAAPPKNKNTRRATIARKTKGKAVSEGHKRRIIEIAKERPVNVAAMESELGLGTKAVRAYLLELTKEGKLIKQFHAPRTSEALWYTPDCLKPPPAIEIAPTPKTNLTATPDKAKQQAKRKAAKQKKMEVAEGVTRQYRQENVRTGVLENIVQYLTYCPVATLSQIEDAVRTKEIFDALDRLISNRVVVRISRFPAQYRLARMPVK